MKRSLAFPSPSARPALAATVCLAVALCCGSVRAQQAGSLPPRPFGEETHVFRRLLFDLKHQPLEQFAIRDPKNTIVIVLGDASRLAQLPGGSLRAFLERGGSVLLASDKSFPGSVNNDLYQLVGCYVFGTHYSYLGRNAAEDCYHGQWYCPFLLPGADAEAKAFFRNPKDHNKPNLRVATNVPSVLSVGINKTRLTGGTVRVAVGPPLISDDGRGAPDDTIMVARQTAGGGRLLLLADHSLFINYMMLPDDNGNVEFAANCMEWLNAGSPTPKKVLFVEESIVNPEFEVPLASPDLNQAREKAAQEFENEVRKGVNQLQASANPLLAEAEENNRFNRWLDAKLTNNGSVSWWQKVGLALVLLTLIGLAVGFFRLVLHGFRQQTPMAPSLARLVDLQEPNQSLMEQRNQGMFKVGNLWEVGRQLARQTFEAAGFTTVKVGDPVPAIHCEGGWWQRRRIRGEVSHLWALAYSRRALPVTPAEWPALLRRLDWLRKSLTARTVRLG